tara:strand:- start:183 stop:455 length:273 start_codon:yes stop_codon:yes gene_type:complete
VAVLVETLLHHMMVLLVDLVVVAEVIELLQTEEMVLVILHQQNQDQHLLHQMDMEIQVEMLRTQVLLVPVVVRVVRVKMEDLLVLMVDLD